MTKGRLIHEWPWIGEHIGVRNYLFFDMVFRALSEVLMEGDKT